MNKLQKKTYRQDLQTLAKYKKCSLDEIEQGLRSLKQRRKLHVSLERLASLLAATAMCAGPQDLLE